MKLLLFSDLHSDLDAAKRLVQQSSQVDVVIGAGDFCNAHHGLDRCLHVLTKIDRPVVLVAGNNESTDELRVSCRNWPAAHVLHGSGVTIKDVAFFGLGGGIPVTPFGSWSYDFTDEEAAQLLADCPSGCILVSHSPPKGAVDRNSRGQSLGSQAIRDAVLRIRPLLVVCGHIHGSAGSHESLGASPVINAGPEGIIWDLENLR